jgi:hypothetical protein
MAEREVLTNVKAGRAATRNPCELVDAKTGAEWIRQRSRFGFLLMGERFGNGGGDTEIGGPLARGDRSHRSAQRPDTSMRCYEVRPQKGGVSIVAPPGDGDVEHGPYLRLVSRM